MEKPTWKFEGLTDNGGYLDYDFSDGNLRRRYIVTFDTDDLAWWGVIQTSETDDGSFDGDEEMSPEILAELRALIPADKLPTPHSCGLVGVDPLDRAGA